MNSTSQLEQNFSKLIGLLPQAHSKSLTGPKIRSQNNPLNSGLSD